MTSQREQEQRVALALELAEKALDALWPPSADHYLYVEQEHGALVTEAIEAIRAARAGLGT